MKKKLFYGAFAVLFLAISLTFSVGLLVFGPSEAAANERLSDPPSLYTQAGELNFSYLSDLKDWVTDRFFLRQELISLDRWLTANVLGTSAQSDVILGSDGWLYYADTLDDYTGIDPMTDRELFCAANNLSLMAQYCQENGKDFVFMIAPNKNSLYPQYMPDYGVTAQTKDSGRLLSALKALGVQTVDLFSAFESQSEILYFAHDSHWNSKGAALGADLINTAFGVESSYFSGDFSTSAAHAGDLYAMLYPAFADSETDPVYGGSLEYTFTSTATQPDAIVLTTESGKQGSLLVYRDSFGNLLFSYLADSYGSARFSRTTAYDLTVDADHVLVELVERNLSYLYTNVPIMASPQRQIPLPNASGGTVTAETAKKGSFTQISGRIPQDVDADSAIYVVSGGQIYEAFCLTENGFSVNLPDGSSAESVICTINSQSMLYAII